MSKPSKYPAYDQAKDGNPFDWIIRQAPTLHAKQAIERRNRPKYDPLTGKPIIPAVKQ